VTVGELLLQLLSLSLPVHEGHTRETAGRFQRADPPQTH
jgi:hypothetical protein